MSEISAHSHTLFAVRFLYQSKCSRIYAEVLLSPTSITIEWVWRRLLMMTLAFWMLCRSHISSAPRRRFIATIRRILLYMAKAAWEEQIHSMFYYTYTKIHYGQGRDLESTYLPLWESRTIVTMLSLAFTILIIFHFISSPALHWNGRISPIAGKHITSKLFDTPEQGITWFDVKNISKFVGRCSKYWMFAVDISKAWRQSTALWQGDIWLVYHHAVSASAFCNRLRRTGLRAHSASLFLPLISAITFHVSTHNYIYGLHFSTKFW